LFSRRRRRLPSRRGFPKPLALRINQFYNYVSLKEVSGGRLGWARLGSLGAAACTPAPWRTLPLPPPTVTNPKPTHHAAQVRREERDIIGELPPKLRAGVLHHLYSDTLERVPAFRGQHPAFLADLVECLRSEYYVEGGGPLAGAAAWAAWAASGAGCGWAGLGWAGLSLVLAGCCLGCGGVSVSRLLGLAM
jgi:hypothetical protein